MAYTHRKWSFGGVLLVVTLLSAGCRGAPSDEPPVHPIRNMYDQPRYDVQQRGQFFRDGRAMRPLVTGTVPREAVVDPEVATGWSDTQQTWVLTVPEPVISDFGGMGQMLVRGQEQFEIYCAPCHGLTGTGDGLIAQRAGGAMVPPTFHDDRLRHAPDGQIFATITNGIRNMPPYGHSVEIGNRWAIVAYLRALQLSQAQSMEARR